MRVMMDRVRTQESSDHEACVEAVQNAEEKLRHLFAGNETSDTVVVQRGNCGHQSRNESARAHAPAAYPFQNPHRTASSTGLSMGV